MDRDITWFHCWFDTDFFVLSSPSFIFIYIISLLIGGFIASFVGGGKNKITLKYGLIIGITFTILMILGEASTGTGTFGYLIYGTVMYTDALNYALAPSIWIGSIIRNLFTIIALFIGVSIFSTIIGTIGGLVGILVNKSMKFDFDNLKRKV